MIKKILTITTVFIFLFVLHFNAYKIAWKLNSPLIIKIAKIFNAPINQENLISKIIAQYKFGCVRDKQTRSIIKLLVSYDFSVNSLDDRKVLSPLAAVSRCLDVEFVKLFLEHGADPNYKTPYGSYPHHLAIEGSGNRSLKIIKLLDNHGGKLHLSDSYGRTCLDISKDSYDSNFNYDNWSLVIKYLEEYNNLIKK